MRPYFIYVFYTDNESVKSKPCSTYLGADRLLKKKMREGEQCQYVKVQYATSEPSIFNLLEEVERLRLHYTEMLLKRKRSIASQNKSEVRSMIHVSHPRA